jgi:hypothetical protein
MTIALVRHGSHNRTSDSAALADLFISQDRPHRCVHIANAVQQWRGQIGVKTLYITPGSL